MTQLSRRTLKFFPYTRKRSSKSIDIRTLGSSVDEIVSNYISLVDFNILYRMIRYSVRITDRVLPSSAEIKDQLITLIKDAVTNYLKTKAEGLYRAEYLSIFLNKVKSGKIVITIYLGIEL